MAPRDGQVPNGSRIIGWKDIAKHLGVSQRTAVRWTEAYHLPVSRIPRGDRPIVFSTVEELDNWWASPAAASLRGDKAPAEGQVAADAGGVVAEPTSQEKARSGEAPWRVSLRRRWIRALVLGLALPLTALAGGYATGFRWPSVNDRTLAWRTRDGAHGEALSTQRVRLVLTVDGKTTSVVVAEGEMARVETPTSRVGLQSRVTKGALKVFVFRLGRAGSRESATFLGSRNLAADGVERLPLDGLSVQLSWRPLDNAGYTARETPKEPCCMVCNGVAVCGELVAGECGRCDASTGPRH
jgi:hypothetical protein